MIQEQYVSFETARLLKEKGFNVKCHTYYNYQSVSYSQHNENWNYNGTFRGGMLSAPTQSLVMRWLREIHNLFIGIIPQEIGLGVSGITFTIDKITEDLWNSLFQDKGFDSYEEAAETAILYALKNLI